MKIENPDSLALNLQFIINKGSIQDFILEQEEKILQSNQQISSICQENYKEMTKNYYKFCQIQQKIKQLKL